MTDLALLVQLALLRPLESDQEVCSLVRHRAVLVQHHTEALQTAKTSTILLSVPENSCQNNVFGCVRISVALKCIAWSAIGLCWFSTTQKLCRHSHQYHSFAFYTRTLVLVIFPSELRESAQLGLPWDHVTSAPHKKL